MECGRKWTTVWWGIDSGNLALNGGGVTRSQRFFCVFFEVPPSSPSCSQAGQISVGGSAILRCSSSEGAPRPVYNWVRLGSSPTPSPGSMVQGESQDIREEGLRTWANQVSKLCAPVPAGRRQMLYLLPASFLVPVLVPPACLPAQSVTT